MKPSLVKFGFLVAAIAGPQLIWADQSTIPYFDQNDFGLDAESISIATGIRSPMAVSPSVATVITREDIETFGYRSVVEAVSHVPGIHVGRRSFGLEPIFSVRGFTSFYTVLWLVDGEPYPQTILGNVGVGLARMPMIAIERIEIMRGPSSAAYGNEAFLGVVNIITKKKTEVTVVSAEMGTYDEFTLQAATGFKLKTADVTVDLDVHSANGYAPFVQNDLQSTLDQNFGTDASLAPGYGGTGEESFNVSSNLSFDKHLMAIRLGVGDGKDTGIGFLPVLDDQGEINTNYAILRYELPLIEVNAYTVKGSVGYFHRNYELNDFQFFPPGAFGGAFPDGLVATLGIEETYWTGRLFGYTDKFTNNLLTYTFQVRNSDVEISHFEANYSTDPVDGLIPDAAGNSAVEGNNDQYTVYTLRLNDEFGIYKSLTGSIGFNADYDEQYNWVVSPRVALIWNTSKELTVKALVGKGVRVPAISETLDASIPVVRPNPNLEPEAITSYDLVIDYTKSPFFGIRANIFYHKTKDQVNQTDAGNGAVMAQNVGFQTGEGLELELKYRPKSTIGLSLYGHYQKNRGGFSVMDEEDEIGYSPHVKGGIKLSYTKNSVNIATTYVYTGDRDRSPNDSRAKAETYGLLGVSASYAFNNNVSVRLKIENALDENIQEASFAGTSPYDIDLPRRSTHIMLKAKF